MVVRAGLHLVAAYVRPIQTDHSGSSRATNEPQPRTTVWGARTRPWVLTWPSLHFAHTRSPGSGSSADPSSAALVCDGVVKPGWPELAAAVGASSVVVPGVLGENRPQVPSAEDQHPVGDLGPGGEDEPFGVSIRARTAGRDLRCRDAGAGQDCVEGAGELPGAVADQEPEVLGVIAKVHQEVADLLGGPRSVR
jgi:hypothetical protein